MKKSSFVTMILGTIGGVLASLGMCMCLLPQWNAFNQGIVTGGAGLAVLLISLLVWRNMENKAPIRLTPKTIGITLLSIVGTLGFGLGMTMVTVWGMLIAGVFVGLIGIVMLLALIPICKGFH